MSKCCGDVPDRIKTLQNGHENIAGAHLMLAEFYEVLAKDLSNTDEKKAMKLAADNQRRLAKESQFATIPEILDLDEEENESEGVSVPGNAGVASGGESPREDTRGGSLPSGSVL